LEQRVNIDLFEEKSEKKLRFVPFIGDFAAEILDSHEGLVEYLIFDLKKLRCGDEIIVRVEDFVHFLLDFINQ
jgi:hypothetical protein